MIPAYELLLEKSRERADFIVRQLKYLTKFDIKNFDHIVADFHDEAFEEINCLDCGNCCRMQTPQWNESDIRRITKLVGLDKDQFVRESLVRDPEEGWRGASLPCPFLQADNACSVYEDRPKDCTLYPYTAERRIKKGLGRLAHNTQICPAAYLVAEKIIERFAKGITKN